MNFHSRGWLHVDLPCGSLFCWLRQTAACLGSWGKMPSAGVSKKPPLLRGLFLYPHWCLLSVILFIGYILWVDPKVPEFPLEKCVLVKTSSLPQNLFRLLPYLRSPPQRKKNKTKWSFQTARNSHGTERSCKNMECVTMARESFTGPGYHLRPSEFSCFSHTFPPVVYATHMIQ